MDFNSTIPAYLTDKKNIFKTVGFTALFALIFINIYSPFGVESRYQVSSQLEFLFYSSLVILIGILVIVISRILLYHRAKKGKRITYLNYSVWIAAEIFFMALFYTLYDKFVLNDLREVWHIFQLTVKNTALVLLIPYSILWLYFAWKDKNLKLEELTSDKPTSEQSGMIPFKDEKGKIKISIKASDLLYIQAADNYVNIIYSHADKQAKYMLRATMKQIEEELHNSGLIRCHRSYMVNFNKVKLIRREKEGLVIELDIVPPVEVPVSKTYMEDVFKAFGHQV